MSNKHARFNLAYIEQFGKESAHCWAYNHFILVICPNRFHVLL